jgi:hypothetical protein
MLRNTLFYIENINAMKMWLPEQALPGIRKVKTRLPYIHKKIIKTIR